MDENSSMLRKLGNLKPKYQNGKGDNYEYRCISPILCYHNLLKNSLTPFGRGGEGGYGNSDLF